MPWDSSADKVMSSDLYQRAMQSAEYIKQHIPADLQTPMVGIICGSGFGELADVILPSRRAGINYGDIPHFPISTVQGHVGRLLFGLLVEDSPPVVLMVGRTHFYEGHSIHHITFPIRVLRLLGIDTLIVTNAAGGLNPTYAVGDIVILNDHLNLAGLAGMHPLRGPNSTEFGVRFPQLSDAYDLGLRRSAHKAWKQIKCTDDYRRLHEGVYAFVGGPSYETRAECRMLQGLGADLVGMSTVPEIIVARHCGIRVLALSLVTNNAVSDPGPRGDDPALEGLTEIELLKASERGAANHEDVLKAGVRAAVDVQIIRLVEHSAES